MALQWEQLEKDDVRDCVNSLQLGLERDRRALPDGPNHNLATGRSILP